MTSKLGKVKLAWHVYKKSLNGVFCVYKPTGLTTYGVRHILKKRIAADLNKLPMFDSELPDPTQERLQAGSGNKTGESQATTGNEVSENSTEETRLTKDMEEDYKPKLDLKLVYGDTFTADDISIGFISPMMARSSGVLLFRLGNRGRNALNMVEDAMFLRVYHVKARLGFATDTFYSDGKLIERSTFHHVSRANLDKVCSSAQSGHQRLMFECAGVNPQSQEAYDLACQGIIRPATIKTRPILYGIKVIYFNPPEFTLEIHAINEICDFLAELTNDIALKLNTNAVCVHIHRIRHGHFTLADTLLHKHWDIEHILSNMEHCDKTHITPERLLTNLQIRPQEIGNDVDDDDDDEDEYHQYSVERDESPSARQMLKAFTKTNKLSSRNRIAAVGVSSDGDVSGSAGGSGVGSAMNDSLVSVEKDPATKRTKTKRENL